MQLEEKVNTVKCIIGKAKGQLSHSESRSGVLRICHTFISKIQSCARTLVKNKEENNTTASPVHMYSCKYMYSYILHVVIHCN